MARSDLRQRAGRWLLSGYVLLVALFLLAPILAITLGSLTNSDYVSFPPKGFSLKWYLGIFDRPEFLVSLGLSLTIAAVAATVATILGLMVGLVIVRYPSRLNLLLRIVVFSPVMLPSIFLGLAFLQLYTQMGFGNTPYSLVAGHVVLVTPFAATLVIAGLEAVDPKLERAARSLGASPWNVLSRVTLPLILWSLAAGWGFAFMMSFGDLSVSLFLSTPSVVTLPVRIYTSLRWSPLDPLLTAISSGLVVITLVVLVVAARLARIERLFGQK